MTGERSEFPFSREYIGGNVTFDKNALDEIKEKWVVILHENTKYKNVLCIYFLKKNLLRLVQILDQGYDVMFHSNYCEIRKAESSK